MRIDWSQVDTVLLDMDGTLLDLEFDNYFWREHVPCVFARVRGISLAESRNILEPMFRDREGSLEWYCIDYWSERLDLDIARLKYELRHRISIRPSVLEFLHWLNCEKQDVRLVTNAHRKVVDLKLAQSGLNAHFSRVHTSHDVGAPKESLQFWQSYVDLFPFDLRRTLLIDDSLPVLQAARDFGIGWLRAISVPDSSERAKEHTHFDGIGSFEEIYVHGASS